MFGQIYIYLFLKCISFLFEESAHAGLLVFRRKSALKFSLSKRQPLCMLM